MAEVINLRLVRKAKARQEVTRQAEENRACFGEKKAVKNQRKAEEKLRIQKLEAGRLQPENSILQKD